jgi:secreted Zn-dependent insulinase-like peptidase
MWSKKTLGTRKPWVLRCRFDLPYACVPLAPEQLRAWEQPDAELAASLALPPRNHYVPTDFTLHCSTQPQDAGTQAANAAAVALMQNLAGQVRLLARSCDTSFPALNH